MVRAYGEITLSVINDGENGANGTSPYFVSVENEFQSIPCTSEGKIYASTLITIPFSGWHGTSRAACTVSVGSLPSGITLGSVTNATKTSAGSIILNVVKGQNFGSDNATTGHITLSFTIEQTTLTRNFTWSKTYAGKDGENALIYSVEPSISVIKRETIETCLLVDESKNNIVDQDGNIIVAFADKDELTPSSITFSSYSQNGNNAKVAYAGRFLIYESENGASYKAASYTSSKDESSIVYKPSTSKLHHIKCVLCMAGGITIQLDSQTVPIIHDATGYDSVIMSFTDTFKNAELSVDQLQKQIDLKVWQKDITNTINEYDKTTVKDIRDRQSNLRVNIDGISSKVSDIETTVNGSADGTKTGLIEKVTQVTTKAGTIEANLKNNYTTTTGMNTQISNSIAASADKIKVTLADGKTESTLKAALDELHTSVKDNAGNISTVTQKANSLETKVTNQGNDIANLKVDAKAVETLVGSSAGTTNVVQKATEFRKTVTDAAGNANTALSAANRNFDLISNMKIGATNRIRHSNDLIFDLYRMVAFLTDESGNQISSEDKMIEVYY